MVETQTRVKLGPLEVEFNCGKVIQGSGNRNKIQIEDFRPGLLDSLRHRCRKVADSSLPEYASPEEAAFLIDFIEKRAQEKNHDIPRIPIIDPYINFHGIDIPKDWLAQTTKQGEPPMSLENDAPEAYELVRSIVDGTGPTHEIQMYGYNRGADIAHLYYHEVGVRDGETLLRPATLPEEEVQEYAMEHGKHMVRHNIEKIHEAGTDSLEDTTLGNHPVEGQREGADTVFLVIYISHRPNNGGPLRIQIDSTIRPLSNLLTQRLPLLPPPVPRSTELKGAKIPGSRRH